MAAEQIDIDREVRMYGVCIVLDLDDELNIIDPTKIRIYKEQGTKYEQVSKDLAKELHLKLATDAEYAAFVMGG